MTGYDKLCLRPTAQLKAYYDDVKSTPGLRKIIRVIFAERFEFCKQTARYNQERIDVNEWR